MCHNFDYLYDISLKICFEICVEVTHGFIKPILLFMLKAQMEWCLKWVGLKWVNGEQNDFKNDLDPELIFLFDEHVFKALLTKWLLSWNRF